MVADNIAVDVTSENTSESVNEGEDVSTVGEAPECIVKIAVEVVETYGVEDCRVETVDEATGTDMAARFVESNIDDKVEDNVGTSLVETAAPKDVARIVDKTVMSAAFAKMLDSMLILFDISFPYLLGYSVYDSLQMCSWDHWEYPRIDDSQILRTYTK